MIVIKYYDLDGFEKQKILGAAKYERNPELLDYIINSIYWDGGGITEIIEDNRPVQELFKELKEKMDQFNKRTKQTYKFYELELHSLHSLLEDI